MPNTVRSRRIQITGGLTVAAALAAIWYLLPNGSLPSIALLPTPTILVLSGLALSTFISEDLALVTAGALVAQGRLGFLPAVVACIVGIFVGDVLLYLAGRLGAGRLLRTPSGRRLVSTEALNRAQQWMGDRTFAVVLLSRFTPGLRLPVYVAAGVLSKDFLKFSSALLLAAVVWTPLLVGAGGAVAESSEAITNGVWGGIALPVAILVGILYAGRRAMRFAAGRRRGRRFLAAIRRRFHWEFLPAWLSYVPVALYIAWLGMRHRCLTVFTAANPGIPYGGGFVGESKSHILSGLGRGGAPIARFTTIDRNLSPAQRSTAARRFMESQELDFPVVLKPDRGERGRGVAVIRSVREMTRYLETAEEDTILQKYVEGREFGIFYYRFRNDETGRILSITRKEFPRVIGDGTSTLADLILADRRASMLASSYLRQSDRNPDEVIPASEAVQLIEIGAHCRGTVFLDGGDLETEALRRAVDEAARALPGFYFGRFDVRSPSVETLKRGEFRILELNGVTSEATHIYDPAISVVEAYRVLFKQWRIAFEIGALNQKAGVQPDDVVGLIRMIRQRGTTENNSVASGETTEAWASKAAIRESA